MDLFRLNAVLKWIYSVKWRNLGFFFLIEINFNGRE
ncbi:MAG: hypothetical protein ACI8P3_002825 [Saprospiraceae bacterium]|jgi:hypothetical protein